MLKYLSFFGIPSRWNTIGTVFSGKNFTRFNEIRYFSRLTQINQNAFASCKAVELLFPSNITKIGDTNVCYGCPNLVSVVIESPALIMGQSTFRECHALQSVTLFATTPPTFAYSNDMTFTNAPNAKIYVPSEAVETYKNNAAWSKYASRIYAIQE